jgi:hypothetical protein
MNQLGNLFGIRLGSRAANRMHNRALTGALSTQVGGSVSGPPHVRAIASRPVPTRPVLTCPGLGADISLRDNFFNSNVKSSFSFGAKFARERVCAGAREALTVDAIRSLLYGEAA